MGTPGSERSAPVARLFLQQRRARRRSPLHPPGIQNNRVFRKEQPKVASREMFYLEGRSLHHQPQKRKLQCQLPQLSTTATSTASASTTSTRTAARSISLALRMSVVTATCSRPSLTATSITSASTTSTRTAARSISLALRVSVVRRGARRRAVADRQQQLQRHPLQRP